MKTRCGLVSISRFLSTRLLVVLTWPFSICPIRRYDGLWSAQIKASTFWKTMTRLIGLIMKTGLVVCKNKIVQLVFFVCCDVDLSQTTGIVQYIKLKQWDFCNFCRNFMCRNRKNLSRSTKRYNNNVQNAYQVWHI